MALIIRQKKDGTIEIADPPDLHVFGSRFLGSIFQRKLGRVLVSLTTSEGELTYQVTGLEYAHPEDPDSAVVGFVCERVEAKPSKPSKEG